MEWESQPRPAAKVNDVDAKPPRLIVISNRLPFSLRKDGDDWHIRTSPGGLVTALSPVLREGGGLWIGWAGVWGEVDLGAQLEAERAAFGFHLRPVELNVDDMENFYQGFSNEVIWPLFHGFPNFCRFKPEYWETYERVNRKFAASVLEHRRADDPVWVHDYHLMNVAHELRRAGATFPLWFFLHIPFPAVDTFQKLPWRVRVIQALLEYDFLGFQTPRDVENFSACVAAIQPETKIEAGADRAVFHLDGRTTVAAAFPVSIDWKEFVRRAGAPDVEKRAKEIRRRLPDRQLILGVDRLDYTKGVPERLESFRRAILQHDDLRRRATLIQVVSPSREDIPRYHELRREVERLVGRINGELTEAGWIPIHYVYRSLDTVELLSWYRAADIALITPLKDGMNLIAKEFCAAQLENDGTLILSEFAGAATQLRDGAMIVNPHDVDEVAEAIYAAVTIRPKERRERMGKLRASIEAHDVFRWVNGFLQEARKQAGRLPRPAAAEAGAAAGGSKPGPAALPPQSTRTPR